MSKIFTKPFRPLDWAATPKDFTTVSGVHQLQLGLYTNESTQRFVYGTRFLSWDGRVFKYALGGTELESYHGCRGMLDAALGYTVAPANHSAGDRMVTITLASRAEDDLAGGQLLLYDLGDMDTSFVRGIIGNTKSDTTVDLYLDFPIHQPVVGATDYMEVFENPYFSVGETTDHYSAWLGVPCVSCATAKKLWIQTWGPAIISPVNATLDDPAESERTVFWSANAGIGEEAHTGITTANQYAGYLLDYGTAALPGPRIMLMCST